MKQINKRKIIRLTKLCFVTAVLFVFFQNLLMPKYMDETKEGALIAEYYDAPLGHDVIFIGDCEVYENFSPLTLWETYGIHSFIRGSASQTIWQSYYLLEDTLKRENPKTVVFNVLSMQYDETVSEAYNRMNLDGMRWSGSKVLAVRESMTEQESFLSYVFPLLRFHSRWQELKGEDFTYLFGRKTVSYNGYLMQTGKKPVQVLPEGKPLTDYRFSEKCYKYLDKMRLLCEENGVRLVLIKAPSLYPYWYDEWETQIEEYAEEYGLDYYNLLELAEDAGIDYSQDTYDGGLHLNVWGAEKLSVYFGKILMENDQFENHEQDEELKKYYAELKIRYEAEKTSVWE